MKPPERFCCRPGRYVVRCWRGRDLGTLSAGCCCLSGCPTRWSVRIHPRNLGAAWPSWFRSRSGHRLARLVLLADRRVGAGDAAARALSDRPSPVEAVAAGAVHLGSRDRAAVPGAAISTDSFDDVVPGARLPFTPPVWLSAIGGALTVVLLVPSVLIGVFGTALRLRRAGQPERQQLSAHSAGHRTRAVLLRRQRRRQRAPARPGVRGRTGRSGRRGTALQPARHRGRSTSKSPFPRATRSATPTDGS